ncbi:hypothetical protein KUCAC02_016090 [Chaenocephalus aceratus]|uniref:Uncharacterized protein n=1 Tax=Chaenocephalus aceratus TaxID=36190 RepID=A0ACB9Y204_CHAAC|nr:hypothetical protein KUCAC02_016090 [Chaenocephalus aceratus]
MMDSNTATMGNLPRGIGICTTIPDILYLPELVFGGLGLDPGGDHAGGAGEPSGLGHVRVPLLLLRDFHLDGDVLLRDAQQQRLLGRSRRCISRHRSLLLPQRFGGLAKVTLEIKETTPLNSQNYKLDISAVVFSYVATLLYFVHTIFSAIRWKSF